MSDQWLVVTTIHPPGRFADCLLDLGRVGWNVVVVGDARTPAAWEELPLTFLSLDAQRDMFGSMAEAAPINHYSRKNFGYLFAIAQGAACILETDDDTFPYPSFGSHVDSRVTGRALGGGRWINVYAHFYDGLIWPRGLPLNSIHDRGTIAPAQTTQSCAIHQFLVDDDPDVDAIHRLLYSQSVRCREDSTPVILEPGCCVPYNSQNTLHFPEAFALLYLPHHCSFRMTDIWRSFVAQAALWPSGGRVCFRPATAHQVRNVHDLMKDFRDEVDGYLHNDAILRTLTEAVTTGELTTTDRLRRLWAALSEAGFVPRDELVLVDRWADAIEATANR